jgi:5'-nucleotidase
MAVSLHAPANVVGELDYQPAANAAHEIAKAVACYGMPSGVLLNVNVPYLPQEDIKGFHITRQGLRVYRDRLDRRVDPRGQPYYWIGGDAPMAIPEYGTDAGALAEGYVSITPLQLDLTAYPAMQTLGRWRLDQGASQPQQIQETGCRTFTDTSLKRKDSP